MHPGERTDLGVMAPFTRRVDRAGHRDRAYERAARGWQWTLASQLGLPGGAAIVLRYDLVGAIVMRLP